MISSLKWTSCFISWRPLVVHVRTTVPQWLAPYNHFTEDFGLGPRWYRGFMKFDLRKKYKKGPGGPLDNLHENANQTQSDEYFRKMGQCSRFIQFSILIQVIPILIPSNNLRSISNRDSKLLRLMRTWAGTSTELGGLGDLVVLAMIQSSFYFLLKMFKKVREMSYWCQTLRIS